MDFLAKAWSQITDLVRSMTPAARVTAALLAGVIVVGLAFLFNFQVESADDYLLGGRPFLAGELIAVQRALSEASLKNWELEGNRIKIPSGQKDVYIAALAENNALPADWNASMDKAIEAANPFRSRHEIDLSLRQAKQKELAMVISRFRNIEQASVMFDETEKDSFRRTKLKTASVAVQTNGAGLEEGQIRAIRQLLVTSYAGLDRANVSITDTTSGLTYALPGENGEGGDNVYAAAKLKYEAEWKKKIHERLSMIPGVVVGVNVELNPEVRADTTTVKIDPKTIPISQSESSLESTQQGPAVSGRPGAVPNGVAPIGNQPAEVAVAQPGPKSTQTESKSEQQAIAGHEQKTSRSSGLVPQRVTATIDIPLSYLARIYRQTNPTPAGEAEKEVDPAELKKLETQEKKRIEDAVVNLLPPVPMGQDMYPLVSVTTYTDLPAPPPVGSAIADQATGWLASNWRTLAMIGVGLVGLAMLRGLLKASIPPEPELNTAAPHARSSGGHSSSAPASSEDETEADPSRPEPILKMRRKMSVKGPNLREELRNLVKEDPDAAANVLRGWIGDAA